MNVGALIKTALVSLNLDVEANAYTGTNQDYITYNYADERPALRADGTDLYDETIIQVHYYTKGNPQTNKQAIRRLLRTAGFTIKNTAEIYESETKYNHVIVYAWIDGVIDD